MIYFTFDPRPDLKDNLKAHLKNETVIFDRQIELENLKKAEILVTYGEDLTDERIDQASELKWVFVASAGIEKMPLQKLEQRGIIVSNVRGIHKTPMAESILGHVLAHYRSLRVIYEEQQQQNWQRRLRSKELSGQKALILGPGAIGGEVGRLLQAFGVETIGCNRSKKQAPYMDKMIGFDELVTFLPQVNIVLSILPSTKETHHLLKEEHFKAMKADALFLNFGRGTLVETEVLINALQNEEIGAAVCDVFEEEPLMKDSPLWTMKNMTVSPHASSHSSRYLERSFEIFNRSIASYRNGAMQDIENIVNLKEGY